MQIDVEGAALQALQPVLQQLFPAILQGLTQRDPVFPAQRLERVEVVADMAAALSRLVPDESWQAGQPTPPSRLLRDRTGAVLLLDGALVSEALEQDPAPLVHLLHRELTRLQLEDELMALPPDDAAVADGLLQRFLPIAQAMWLEYATNRRTLASLPPSADLLLPHLVDLCRVLPDAMAEDIGAYYLQPDLDALAAKGFARLAHLGHAMAHAQGYLAAAGETLEGLKPEFAGAMARTPLGGLWPIFAMALEQLWRGHDATAIGLQLRGLVLPLRQALAVLGLDARRSEDGALWLEVRPLSPESLQQLLAGGETLH